MADFQRICIVDGCDKSAGKPGTARGYCRSHYHKLMTYGDLNADPRAARRKDALDRREAEKRVKATAREKKRQSVLLCVVEGCGGAAIKRGWCNKHYKRAWKYGDPLVTRSAPNGALKEWLDQHISYAGKDCLRWPFAGGGDGRGRMDLNGVGMNAARAMCILAHGAPPQPDMDAAHSCGNGHLGCVNPSHLRWATRQENNDERPRLRRGAKHGNAKLSPIDVLGIRLMASCRSLTKVAEEFGCNQKTVGSIVRRKAWKHI